MTLLKRTIACLGLLGASFALVACTTNQQTIQGTTSKTAQTTTASLTAKEAEEVALKDAGLTADAVTYISSKQDQEDGQAVYEITFQTQDTEYDYTISVQSGTVLSKDQEVLTKTATTTTTTMAVTSEKAKDIALKAAGLSETAVSNLRIEQDQDNGRAVFEISFDDLNTQTDYDYTIDAETGEILEQSQEPLND